MLLKIVAMAAMILPSQLMTSMLQWHATWATHNYSQLMKEMRGIQWGGKTVTQRNISTWDEWMKILEALYHWLMITGLFCFIWICYLLASCHFVFLCINTLACKQWNQFNFYFQYKASGFLLCLSKKSNS